MYICSKIRYSKTYIAKQVPNSCLSTKITHKIALLKKVKIWKKMCTRTTVIPTFYSLLVRINCCAYLKFFST